MKRDSVAIDATLARVRNLTRATRSTRTARALDEASLKCGAVCLRYPASKYSRGCRRILTKL